MKVLSSTFLFDTISNIVSSFVIIISTLEFVQIELEFVKKLFFEYKKRPQC